MNTKQAVQDLLQKLPDNCTLDDLQYHLYVLQAVERGREEIAAGKKLSHEEVKRELRAAVLHGAREFKPYPPCFSSAAANSRAET